MNLVLCANIFKNLIELSFDLSKQYEANNLFKFNLFHFINWS